MSALLNRVVFYAPIAKQNCQRASHLDNQRSYQRMNECKHLEALFYFVGKLQHSGITWVLTGSLGLVIRGIQTTVGDIDIETDVSGVYQIEDMLSDEVIDPVELVEDRLTRSHLGMLQIGGVNVEISGGMQYRLLDGNWMSAPDLKALSTVMYVEGNSVPVLPLEYELEAYRGMKRLDKVELISSHLQRN